MWPFDEEIKDWFEEVKALREAKRNGAEPDDDFSGMDENEVSFSHA